MPLILGLTATIRRHKANRSQHAPNLSSPLTFWVLQPQSVGIKPTDSMPPIFFSPFPFWVLQPQSVGIKPTDHSMPLILGLTATIRRHKADRSQHAPNLFFSFDVLGLTAT